MRAATILAFATGAGLTIQVGVHWLTSGSFDHHVWHDAMLWAAIGFTWLERRR